MDSLCKCRNINRCGLVLSFQPNRLLVMTVDENIMKFKMSNIIMPGYEDL